MGIPLEATESGPRRRIHRDKTKADAGALGGAGVGAHPNHFGGANVDLAAFDVEAQGELITDTEGLLGGHEHPSVRDILTPSADRMAGGVGDDVDGAQKRGSFRKAGGLHGSSKGQPAPGAGQWRQLSTSGATMPPATNHLQFLV